MKYLFSLALLLSPLAQADLNSYVGLWRQMDSGREIRLETMDNFLTGSTTVRYVDPEGRPTNETIEYFFQFQEEDGPQMVRGRLSTFDSHYNCYLENGDAFVQKLDFDRIKIGFHRILFKVQETRSMERWERRPKYCQSYYDGRAYFCGFEWREIPGRLLGRKCIITERIPTAVQLEKVY